MQFLRAAVPLVLVIGLSARASASPRLDAIELHTKAKELRASGDLDGALEAYIAAHEKYADAKVCEWMFNRFVETGRDVEALHLLERILAEERPASAMAWAEGELMAVAERVTKIESAEKAAAEARRKKAAAEEAAKAKAEAQAKAKAKAKAKAAKEAALKQQIADQKVAIERSAEAARQSVHARWQERLRTHDRALAVPTQLVLWGTVAGVLGLAGHSVFAVGAADKRRESADCLTEFLMSESCSSAQAKSLIDEADSGEVDANVSLAVAGVGLAAAVAGAVMLWRIPAVDPAKGVDGSGSAASTPTFVPGVDSVAIRGAF